MSVGEIVVAVLLFGYSVMMLWIIERDHQENRRREAEFRENMQENLRWLVQGYIRNTAHEVAVHAEEELRGRIAALIASHGTDAVVDEVTLQVSKVGTAELASGKGEGP